MYALNLGTRVHEALDVLEYANLPSGHCAVGPADQERPSATPRHKMWCLLTFIGPWNDFLWPFLTSAPTSRKAAHAATLWAMFKLTRRTIANTVPSSD